MQFFQDIHFPTDNRLRLDIGLLPLADPPSLPQRFAPSPSSFPTDDDIGPTIQDTESRPTLAGVVAAALRNVAAIFTATLPARPQIHSR